MAPRFIEIILSHHLPISPRLLGSVNPAASVTEFMYLELFGLITILEHGVPVWLPNFMTLRSSLCGNVGVIIDIVRGRKPPRNPPAL